MKLAGKEVVYGESLTLSQMNYLETRLDALVSEIEKIDTVDVAFYEASRSSEASYLTVMFDNEESIEISVRNHVNNYSSADSFLWISNYKNWTELKNDALLTVNSFLKDGKVSMFFKGQVVSN